MAERAVRERGVSIRMACEIFQVSQSCYRYAPRARAENEEIVQWLLRLTDNHRNWGFGLCFLYLRNVKGFAWNHKRVYRIYRELELNLSSVNQDERSASIKMRIPARAGGWRA